MSSDRLFSEYDLHGVLQGHLVKARETVDAIPESQFIHTDDETIFAHVLSKLEILPIQLHEERKEMEQTETTVDVRHDFQRFVEDKSKPCLVPGLRVVVSIPFTGEEMLWKTQPSTFTLNPPRGQIRGVGRDGVGYLDIVMDRPSDALGGGFKAELENTLQSIRQNLDRIRQDVEASNEQLKGHIRQAIASRRERLKRHASVTEDLNIPLKKRPGSPDFSALPVRRRIVTPLASAPTRPPEPAISNEDYEGILGVIRHTGRSFESTPATFAVHDEEELRNIVLANLNGLYEGSASGERFRKFGKTDVCIEDSNRAAFVAECKVWRGSKEILDAATQLFGYLTWRDCKTALIVFNQHVAAFSDIQRDLPKALEQHSCYQNTLPYGEQGEWQLRFRSLEDPNRPVLIRVFLFNLYCPGEVKTTGRARTSQKRKN